MAASSYKHLSDPLQIQIGKFYSEHVKFNQSLLIGFSGGLDSTVLLHASYVALRDTAICFSALHVNHALSENADRWTEHCRNVCHQLGVPLETKRVSVPLNSGAGVEHAARMARRDALHQEQSDWIALAHHAEDQSETVLHNMLRGSGILGLAGMRSVEGKLLRPLLSYRRKYLHAYAERNELTWIEDESNTDVRFTRNFLRHEVLRLARSRFPNLDQKISTTARHCEEAQSLLDEIARSDLAENTATFPLKVSILKQLSVPRAKNLLRALLRWHGEQAPPETRLVEFLRQIREARMDRHPELCLPRYSLKLKRGNVHLEIVGQQ